MIDPRDRRAFLRTAIAASAAWAAADLLQVEQALAFAAQQATAAPSNATTTLTVAQADVVVAMTSRILPSMDGRPGAREAGVLFFIDKALGTFNAAARPLYLGGVADLDRRAREKVSGSAGFAALAPVQQDQILREIEATPFFQSVRFDTLVGMFAVPAYGGNRDYMGWHMLGFDHQPTFQAPFGFYDAEINRRG